MYGIYGDIIAAAQRALGDFEETKELLEYPEVQADKAYYLSVLSKYNNLNFLKEKTAALIFTLEEQNAALSLLSEAQSEEERLEINGEISSLKRAASALSCTISDALGCRHAEERAYCRFKLQESSSRFGAALYNLIKADLLSRGAKVADEKKSISKGGYVQEISFIAEGADVISRLSTLSGEHKVYVAPLNCEELCFAVTSAPDYPEISENDLKIDVFHSHGAGGQNINKVETAVRVTHIPTGLVVVCQDERSQLKNKKRAIETLSKRLKDRCEQAEKSRMEQDIRVQHNIKNTPITFDAKGNTMSDTRLAYFAKIPFPPTSEQFSSYLNGLIAL